MNKSYRIIWNKARACFIVVSENAKSLGKASTKKTSAFIEAAVAAAILVGGAQDARSSQTWASGDYLVDGTSSISNGLWATNANVGSLAVINTGSISNTSSVNFQGTALSIKSSTLSGSILNSGLISVSPINFAAVLGAIALTRSTVLGGITNTGSIQGGYSIAIRTSSVQGRISNEGSMSGHIYGLTSTLSGGIDNSGSAGAIELYSTTVTNGINNGGTLNGNLSIYNSSVVGGVTNSGSISGINGGMSLTNDNVDTVSNIGSIRGLGISNSSVTGSLNNGGSVLSNYVAIQVNNSRLDSGITNSGVVIGAGTAYSAGIGLQVVNSSVSGGVTNSGTIQGHNAAGIDIYGSAISNGILNQGGGTVSGALAGLQIGAHYTSSGYLHKAYGSGASVSGVIINSGIIQGGVEGINVVGSQLANGIFNQNGGTISGGQYGVAIEVGVPAIGSPVGSIILGGITNSGLIQGGANSGNAGLFNDASSIDSITNTGTIIGYYGINNQGTIGTIVNAQGGVGATSGPLTYNGNLPSNYTALIGSQPHYGQLNVTGTYSGQIVTFNVGTIAGSTPASGTYRGVLQGISYSGIAGLTSAVSTLAGTIAGTSYAWVLADDVSSATYWDLILSGYIPPAHTPSANYVSVVTANNNPAAFGAAQVLDTAATVGTPGLANVITQLNNIGSTSGSLAQSNAISQTLPVIIGAGSQAAAQNQQGLNQIMQGRQNQLRGLSSGEEFIGTKDVWMKGYGSWANQGDVNNVSGYKVNTGGLAVGIDKQLSPKSNIGAVFAFGNSSVSSNSNVAPSGITVNSYQLGAYGDYAIKSDLQANYQADVGLNNNKSYRNLSDFGGVQGIGANANATYNSTVAHVGAGLRQFVPLTDKTTFIPSIRADYTTVQSQGYTESGGGALNLNVNSQSYNMVMFSVDLRTDQQLTERLKLSANVGGGYNTLNNQVQITSAYQGGGAAFVSQGLQVSPWLYNAGLGVSGNLHKSTELNVRYDTQFSSTGYNNQMVSAKVKFWYWGVGCKNWCDKLEKCEKARYFRPFSFFG